LTSKRIITASEELLVTRFRITRNMEYCRSSDLSFVAGVGRAAQIGYRWIEPMIHTGWELLSEVYYFHYIARGQRYSNPHTNTSGPV
jgi:hypothetical protein